LFLDDRSVRVHRRQMTESDLSAARAASGGKGKGEGCKLRLVCTSVHLSPAVARGVIWASAACMDTVDDALIDEAIAGAPKAAQAPAMLSAMAWSRRRGRV
jgi:hypothetical protein